MKAYTSHCNSRFLGCLTALVLGISLLSAPSLASCVGRSACGEILQAGYRPGARQASFLDAHRSSRRRGDSRFYDRRQGILDHQWSTTCATFTRLRPAFAATSISLPPAATSTLSVTEISNETSTDPDLKIFIEPADRSSISASTGLHGYVSAGEAEAYKKELEASRLQTADQIHAAEAHVADEENHFRAGYATKLRFDYGLDPKAARGRSR